MLSPLTVIVASLAWAAVLFGVALWGERNTSRLGRIWPLVYTLSLAVHCTAWTYYGAVAQAVRWQFPSPPTYLGIVLLLVLGFNFLQRLGRLTHEHNSASLADLVTSRFGKDRRLGIAITAVALLGMVPYIALQLKAVALSFTLLIGGDPNAQPAYLDASLWIALVMAAFTMLFGTRRASATEHNRGIVLALGFESLLKLAALLAVGAFVVWGTHDGFADLAQRAQALPAGDYDGSFYALMGLGAIAMFTLPHQFHVGIVELRSNRDLRTARWLFPLYLLLIALPVLPIAWAGQLDLGARVPADLYVLALPLASGQKGLALLTFLGGMSAATGMAILSALTLSIMLANHWISPHFVRDAARASSGSDLRPWVLANRRFGIALVFVLAWLYSQAMSGAKALADFGILSFSALAQLAPAVVLAVYRPRLPSGAVLAGLLLGSLVWLWLMLVPTAMEAGLLPRLSPGPAWHWLTPHDFLWLGWMHDVARGVLVSLLVNVATVLLVARFMPLKPDAARGGIAVTALENVARRFLPRDYVRELAERNGHDATADEAMVATVERELAAVVGVSSARLLIDAAWRGESAPLDTVAELVGEATQALRFNQQVLEAALQNMSQGISVVDREQRLVAWNRRYAQMFGFPADLLQVGRPIADLTAWALQRMPHRGHDQHALQRRLDFMRAGTPHLTERVFPDGSIVEIRGNPMPGGGFVATYTDITASRHAERELKRANETLEQRVADRTARLETAKREAEHANDAKSRFLTAIGHDLLQPLHAAQLFTDALSQQLSVPRQRESVAQIRGALDSTTDLLTGLLDMSRLEAGGLVPEPRDVPLAEILEPLASEFGVLAREHGLAFKCVPTQAWVHTDPQLLRRILQNFLANAVRYTVHGGVLLGVRRIGADRLRVEVVDSGPGIAEAERCAIFEEFRRGEDVAGQGLGLGLSIADRIAGLIGAPLSLRSRVGHGAAFAVELRRVAALSQPSAPAIARTGIGGRRVLAVDNDPAALQALSQVLEGWGCDVAVAADARGAEQALSARPADLWLFDYHLDEGDTGVALASRLRARFGARPCLILSADQTDAVRRAVREADLPLLAKPVRPLALKSVLDRLLSARTSDSADAPAGTVPGDVAGHASERDADDMPGGARV
ncbi:hybrid sensor histidine kinase/response regulator [Luteimonas sp. RIT-PG2_3]